MGLRFTTGNMFESLGEAIVNTVNCVGVMGKGVALEFKRRWPENYRAYKRVCDTGALRPGKIFVFENQDMFDPQGRRFLVNFPTKDHWREGARMEFIDHGLDDFVSWMQRLRIRSVVMPPLGCGNGGLDWRKVREVIQEKLSQLTETDIIVFEP